MRPRHTSVTHLDGRALAADARILGLVRRRNLGVLFVRDRLLPLERLHLARMLLFGGACRAHRSAHTRAARAAAAAECGQLVCVRIAGLADRVRLQRHDLADLRARQPRVALDRRERARHALHARLLLELCGGGRRGLLLGRLLAAAGRAAGHAQLGRQRRRGRLGLGAAVLGVARVARATGGVRADHGRGEDALPVLEQRRLDVRVRRREVAVGLLAKLALGLVGRRRRRAKFARRVRLPLVRELDIVLGELRH